ncbi:hypothetical protein QA641_23695 [Bradyrhizobium sp. CB1650]|uniref:hypothetical protein n=1 Tax=Bradyrhizobium sp. CB1650 TaxID=3039153 RepID=UPI0024350B4C|nr:hypothetical protein [Bradyrhizobium sp. CB1650]WGD48656.1 hypothetical protein QA641_23695 [Bradyrhizobium sp. CB1650]
MPLADRYWFERAAEIKVMAADGSLVRRGSGYMIAPGVILTALHVVAGADPLPQDPKVCRVRLLADINAADELDKVEFHDAEVKWPAPGSSIQNAGDAALVVVKEQQRTHSMKDCAALPVSTSFKGRDVIGVGMPALARKIDPHSAGFEEINGRIASRLQSNALLRLTLDNQKHPNPDEWKGASGAVLLDAKAEALVGILVHADHTGYEEIRSDISRPLMLEMLADFSGTDEFRKVVALETASDASVSSTEIPKDLFDKALGLLHRLDRTNQVRQFGNVMNKAATGSYRPVVLVSRMKEPDCPDVFIKTLSDQLVQMLKDRRNCYGEPSNLSWPIGIVPHRAVARLKSYIIGDVGAADEAGLDAALMAGQNKRLFAVRIPSEVETPTPDEMKALFRWWFARPSCEGGPAVLLVLIVDSLSDDKECPRAMDIFKLIDSLFGGPPPFDDDEQILEPLARCRVQDLEDWTNCSLKDHLGNHRNALMKRLNTAITERVGSGNNFRLRIIQEALY